MHLNIIIRTHSLGNVHKNEQRVMTDSKEEMLVRCVYSLFLSINNVNKNLGHDIRVTVIDDHSSESCIKMLSKMIARCNYPAELIHLEGTGNNASLTKCYEFAREHARDVIYFVEDDYLHFPSAISEMIEAYELFKKNLGENREVGILLNDDPDNYKPEWIKPSRIVLGQYRHWRTNDSSNGTFLISKAVFERFFDIFKAFADYGQGEHAQEGMTIDRLWKKPVTLFTPIPALALHMHHNFRIAPFIHWRSLWDLIDVTEIS